MSKLIGRKISHQLLENKLTELWKSIENLVLIDLGWDFYIAKFSQEENKQKTLHDGLWFVIGGFLLVQQWVPNFILQESTITNSTIWTRLP